MGKTLVFGASLRPDRYSNIALNRLKNAGEQVIAFGMQQGEVAGVAVSKELKPYENVDTVTLYMNPHWQKSYYDYIIGLRPGRVIFNPGTENPEFYRLLEENDIGVEVACTLVLLSTDQY